MKIGSILFAGILLAARPALAQSDEPAAQSDAPLYPASAYLDPEHVMIGDMIVDVSAEVSSGPIKAGFALKGTPLWPGGIIPLQFSPEYTSQEKATVFAACAQWSRKANVRCVARSNEDRFLSIIKDPNSPSCYSHLGYNPSGGQMSFNLKPAYCWEQPGGRIMHEFGHAFGLRHEQTRPDRDQFITMRWENVSTDPSTRAQFAKVSGQPRATKYDFESIMHYGPGQGGGKGPAFTVNSGYEKYQRSVGQRKGVSPMDGEVLASLYGPPVASAELVAINASDEHAPDLVADSVPEPAADLVNVGQQVYAEEDADKASVDSANVKELPLLAWTLELVSDDQYKSWRESVKPAAEAAKFLKPARGEVLTESYATLARRALQKAPPCHQADSFLKEWPDAGQQALDSKDLALGRWRQELWRKSAYGAAKSKRALAIAQSHVKAAGLWNEGKLCEAAAIFVKLAPGKQIAPASTPEKKTARPIVSKSAPQKQVGPFARRKDALRDLLRVLSASGDDASYARFYGTAPIFAKMNASCRSHYSARTNFLQSASLSLAAFEYRESIQSGADSKTQRKAEAAIEGLRKEGAVPLLLDPYLQAPRACLPDLKNGDVHADESFDRSPAAKTAAGEAGIRRWLNLTEATSRYSERSDLKTSQRVRLHYALARGYERLAGMYAAAGAGKASDEDAAADEAQADMSEEQAANAFEQAVGDRAADEHSD